jgi:hypothetical protein
MAATQAVGDTHEDASADFARSTTGWTSLHIRELKPITHTRSLLSDLALTCRIAVWAGAAS